MTPLVSYPIVVFIDVAIIRGVFHMRIKSCICTACVYFYTRMNWTGMFIYLNVYLLYFHFFPRTISQKSKENKTFLSSITHNMVTESHSSMLKIVQSLV